MDKSNLANTNWKWWQFRWREGWTPDSKTRFGWEVSTRSIQDEEEQRKWISSLINWCSPWMLVKIYSLDPLYDVLSFLNYVILLALKLQRATDKKGFFYWFCQDLTQFFS